MTDDPLLLAARAAQAHAVVPLSGFRVGAALQANDGRMFSGANVETATLNLGLCAERVALFTALAAGARQFNRLVIATNAGAPTPPCGACRQLLWEFAPDIAIRSAAADQTADFGLGDLLPHPFDWRCVDDSAS